MNHGCWRGLDDNQPIDGHSEGRETGRGPDLMSNQSSRDSHPRYRVRRVLSPMVTQMQVLEVV
jgi:hypothetical protein